MTQRRDEYATVTVLRGPEHGFIDSRPRHGLLVAGVRGLFVIQRMVVISGCEHMIAARWLPFQTQKPVSFFGDLALGLFCPFFPCSVCSTCPTGRKRQIFLHWSKRGQTLRDGLAIDLSGDLKVRAMTRIVRLGAMAAGIAATVERTGDRAWLEVAEVSLLQVIHTLMSGRQKSANSQSITFASRTQALTGNTLGNITVLSYLVAHATK